MNETSIDISDLNSGRIEKCYNPYVVGFLFSRDMKRVLLIEKQKPHSWKGKLNGIGGKVGYKESSADAMVREFEEETGLRIDDWKYKVRLWRGDRRIDFYSTVSDSIEKAQSVEKERVIIVAVEPLPSNVLLGLRWLIPVCLPGNMRVPVVVRLL